MIGESQRPVKNTNILDFIKDVSGKGNRFIGLITETRPKVRKTGNPHPDVIKLTDASYDMNIDYENKVANARERAGLDREYEKGTSYFEVLRDEQGRLTPLAKHKTKDQYYFYAARRPGGTSRYFSEDGQELDFETQVKPFMPESTGSSRQGLEFEDQVKPRTIGFDSIKAIKFSGQCLLCAND